MRWKALALEDVQKISELAVNITNNNNTAGQLQKSRLLQEHMPASSMKCLNALPTDRLLVTRAHSQLLERSAVLIARGTKPLTASFAG